MAQTQVFYHIAEIRQQLHVQKTTMRRPPYSRVVMGGTINPTTGDHKPCRSASKPSSQLWQYDARSRSQSRSHPFTGLAATGKLPMVLLWGTPPRASDDALRHDTQTHSY